MAPPTCGRILLHTSYGDVDIELWSKEAPKACRNFVQLALEGFYDETIFHRVMKGALVQGGDPTGTGEGKETTWGKPFSDEFHSRIKFNHRGQVAMANGGYPNSNGCQFFFTLDQTPWLDQKHTIFGKITGNTIFNAIRMGDTEVDENDRPFDPPRLDSIEVIVNPFDDLVPRAIQPKKPGEAAESGQQTKVQVQRAERRKRSSKKDFKLLSFGEEAEEEATITTSGSGIRFVNDPKKKQKSIGESITSNSGKSEGGAKKGADSNMTAKKGSKSKSKSKPMRDEDDPTPPQSPVRTIAYGMLNPKAKAGDKNTSIPEKGSDDNKQMHHDWVYGDDQERSKRDAMNVKTLQVEALQKELHEQQLAAEAERKRRAGDENPSTSSLSVLEQSFFLLRSQMRLKYKKPKVSASQRESDTLAKLSKFKSRKNDQDDEDEYDDWLPEKDFSDANPII